MPRIMIVDDEVVLHDLIVKVFHGLNYEFVSFTTAQAALASLESPVDVALVDKNLPDGSGLDVIRALKTRQPDVEVLLLTAYASVESAIEAVKIGAFDYLTKPFDDLHVLQMRVVNALDKVGYKREQQRLLQRVVESEQRYALAARGANDGLWDWNLKTGEVYFSARWAAMLGGKEAAHHGHVDEWFARIAPDDVDRVRSLFAAHVSGAASQVACEYRLRHDDGSYRWMLCRGMVVRDKAGAAYRVVGSQTDVSDRKEAEEQLAFAALHDGLTRLPNRVLFNDRLERAIARASEHKDLRFAVLLLDLDRFKLLNDGLGHGAGDELLLAIADRLRAALRSSDTVARLSGDEFAVLLDGIDGEVEATRVAQSLLKAVGQPLSVRGHEVFSSASIGIAMSATTRQSPDDYLRDADIAMHRAKARGSAGCEVFEATMHAQALERLSLENALRRALERQEFRLVYQPILALDTGIIRGFEALLRWTMPDGTVIPPVEFVPLAEETGLILPLGAWAFEEVCRQMQAWRRDSVAARDLYVSVNLSARQFEDSELIHRIERGMGVYGLDGRSLKFEITETVIMRNPEAAARVLSRLRELDVQVAMDDFGTGYSSLSQLHKFRVDQLKIDRSFVSSLTSSKQKREIVETIMSLSRSLGLDVVAEGIETAGQLLALREMRCSFGQGYLFARPAEPLDAATFFGRALA